LDKIAGLIDWDRTGDYWTRFIMSQRFANNTYVRRVKCSDVLE